MRTVILVAAVGLVGIVLVILAGSETSEERPPGDGSRVSSPPVSLSEPYDVYDPIRAGENPPPGYRQLLARDDIAPVYDPTFVTAEASPWPDDALVIGVEIDGESKAYPVGFLNRREMVIDRLSGVPILVTW